jgi:hypothetical protein
MNENETNRLLDALVMRTQNETSFSTLSDKEKGIAAVDRLVGTATRSGLEDFFTPPNSFLFEHAARGLEWIGSEKLRQEFEKAWQSFREKGAAQTEALQRLIVVKEFELIHRRIREFVVANLNKSNI